jgi:hypothetical protein
VYGREAAESTFVNHWRATDAMAARHCLGEDMRISIEQTYERCASDGGRRCAGERCLTLLRS